MDPVRPVASRAVLLLVIAGLVMTSCGESNGGNPGAPSNGGGSGGGSGSVTCRTYPTAATVTRARGSLRNTAQLTGSFDSSANTLTVWMALSTRDTDGVCSTAVSTYRSTADFVDEVRVIPGPTMPTSTTTTLGGVCDSGTSTINYVYDSQRRLMSSTTDGVTATYRSWDSAGRPTAGSLPDRTIVNTYNDSTRTWVQTYTAAASTWTTTVTYDANGAQTSVVTISGAITETTTFNPTATAQVCK